MKVYSVQLLLQKESWHVLDGHEELGMLASQVLIPEQRCLQRQVKMQFYFIVKYHNVDRKFKKSNSP